MAAASGMFALAVSAVVVIALVYGVHRMTAVSSSVLRNRMPYLSGRGPSEHALSRFHVRWYPLTLLFLAFDVEMLFMYPWALIVADVGAEAVIEMFVFLGLLLAGVVWAWREGALRWT